MKAKLGRLFAGLFIVGISYCFIHQSDASTEVEKAPINNNGSSHKSSFFNLQNFVEQSDLVFRGSVQKIQYQLSEPSGPEQVRVPYTFVTYGVEEVLQGSTENNLVTLQFIGGLDEQKMRYMTASNAPQFDIGDNDILFVQGNTQKLVPLVDNHHGRLRVINNHVYTEKGRSVELDNKGNLKLGSHHMLDEVMKTTVKGIGGTRTFSSRLDTTVGEKAGVNAVKKQTNAIISEVVVKRIKNLKLKQGVQARKQKGAGNNFLNARSDNALFAPDMKPRKAPQQPVSRESMKSVAPNYEQEKTEEVEEISPQTKTEIIY